MYVSVGRLVYEVRNIELDCIRIYVHPKTSEMRHRQKNTAFKETFDYGTTQTDIHYMCVCVCFVVPSNFSPAHGKKVAL